MKAIFFVACFVLAITTRASHNKAGEITYRRLASLTYEVTLTTYTENGNPQSVDADRPQVTISWGDGKSSIINRASRTNLPYATWKNTYIGHHIYTTPGSYPISFSDANRIDGIVNMGQSFTSPFFLTSTMLVQAAGNGNSSPLMRTEAFTTATLNQPFTYNLQAYDSDMDSMFFFLVTPLQGLNNEVPDYVRPHASASFELNEYTGILYWKNPDLKGIYTIAIRIDEYRYPNGNKVKLGSIFREVMVVVDGFGSGTGINSLTEIPFDVYPNPARSNIFIQSEGWTVDPVYLTIADLTGKVVSNETVYAASGGTINHTQQINLSSGIYLFTLTQGNRVAHYKVAVE